MNTSYFNKYRGADAISVCLRPPYWYKGKRCDELAPKPWFFEKYKKDHDKDFFIKHYYKEVLDKLNPQDIYNILGENAVLLCWEEPGEFCHRRLIAEWLEWELNIEINEL